MTTVAKLADTVPVHAWNQARDQLAISPNSSVIEIYDTTATDPKHWKKIHELTNVSCGVVSAAWMFRCVNVHVLNGIPYEIPRNGRSGDI